MDPDFQQAVVRCREHLRHSTNLGQSGDFHDVYYLIDYLASVVHLNYTAIPCKAGCHGCCLDSGLPRVTALEWQVIHDHLVNDLSLGTQAQIIDQTRRLHQDQVPALLEEQRHIQRPHTDESGLHLAKPDLKSMRCPLLVDGRCSVYQVRPGTCRAYGFFTVRVRQQSQLFACRMAADTVVEDLKLQGVEEWAMPVWDKFAERIYALNGDVGTVATLPLWILSHADGDRFRPDCQRQPDFSGLG